MGLFKRCEHHGRSRDRCSCPWHGSFRGYRVSLTKWADQDVTTRKDAEAVLDQFRHEVREAMRAGLDGAALWAKLAAGLKPRVETKPLTFREVAGLYLQKGVQERKLKSAAPLAQVQQLLGHSSVVTTMRYVTTKDDQLQAAVMRLPASPISTHADADHDEVSQFLHSDRLTDDTRLTLSKSDSQIT